MKKLLAVVCVALTSAACGPTIDLTERPQFSNGVNTVTFLVYDAFTGAPIEDATIVVQVGPHAIEAVRPEGGGNAYIAAQLPNGQHLATINAPGHIGMIGQPNLTAPGTATLTNQFFKTYQVALFPETSVATTLTVKAFENVTGAPITAGTLVATLADNSNIGPDFDDLLEGTLTVRPTTITVQFDATGTATIPAASLVLGGEYQLDVFNARANPGTGEVYLQPEQNVTWVAGESLPNVTIFLGPPAEFPRAVRTNNEDNEIVTRLEVTFPYPIELCSDNDEDSFFFNIFPGDGDGDLEQTTADADDPVSTTIAGNVLHVTPNFETRDAEDGWTEVTFQGVRVRIVGSSACEDLDDVGLRDTFSDVDPTIRIQ